jgi:hypothetical protein
MDQYSPFSEKLGNSKFRFSKRGGFPPVEADVEFGW